MQRFLPSGTPPAPGPPVPAHAVRLPAGTVRTAAGRRQGPPPGGNGPAQRPCPVIPVAAFLASSRTASSSTCMVTPKLSNRLPVSPSSCRVMDTSVSSPGDGTPERRPDGLETPGQRSVLPRRVPPLQGFPVTLRPAPKAQTGLFAGSAAPPGWRSSPIRYSESRSFVPDCR